MPRKHVTYEDRIVVNPEIMVGKPVVRGTRIPVERVIRHLADNPDVDDLFEAFPHLTIEDVKACLAYAHDRPEGRPRGGRQPASTAGRARA